jgi:outer membrane protein assembly factor BamB
MPDLRQLVQRQMQQVELRPFTLEGFHRRRDRRHRNQRIGSMVLAGAIGLAAVGVALDAFRHSTEPTPLAPTITADNAASLRLAWMADLPDPVNAADASYGEGITLADGVLFVTDRQDGRLYAFDEHCGEGGETCQPLWKTERIDVTQLMPDGPVVADGRVIIGADHSLMAYATNCASGGAVCRPDWRMTLNGALFTQPVVSNGVVYSATAEGRVGRMVAVAVDCATAGTACRPLWTSAPQGEELVTGPVIGHVVYANDGAFAHQETDRAYAFSLDCRDGCGPVWQGRSDEAFMGVATQSGGKVFIGTGPDGTVSMRLARCMGTSSSCDPVWVGSTANTVNIPRPAVGDGMVVVDSSQDSLVRAFPVRCSTPCDPAWTAFPRSVDQNAIVIRDGVVWIASPNDGLIAYAARCGTGKALCTPLWQSAGVDGTPGQRAVAVGDGMVFAASDITGDVYAFSPA